MKNGGKNKSVAFIILFSLCICIYIHTLFIIVFPVNFQLLIRKIYIICSKGCLEPVVPT